MIASPLSSLGVRPCVLVVDGDVESLQQYCEAFTLYGWSVAQARDGREALVQALTARPWIVVTELRLAMIDGISLCEILRRDRATSAVPILALTSETRPAELARAHHAGVDAVLIKPSSPDVVVAEMQRLLQAAQPSLPRREAPAPDGHRKTLVKAHHRHSTTTPSLAPIDLTCPMCGQPLRYQETFIGGVSVRHSERWDYYECARCGRFQYRYRTRKLRYLA